MSNFELYKKWAERFIERTWREEEEERKAKEAQANKPKSEEPVSNKIEIPVFKGAFFLGEEWGRQIHKKVQDKYGSYEVISKVKYNDKDKVVEGSTPFYVAAVQEFLPENARAAAQADLEKILKGNLLPLKDHWEDSALVWRSNQEPNKYLAEDLFSQFKSKGINLEENSAYVIPLFTLKLRGDSKSKHKLAFELTDLALQSYFEAPILNEISQLKFNSKDIDENTGLPTKVGKSGDRTLYTRNWDRYTIKNSGLVRLYFNRVLSIYSCYEVLADSGASGRVVVFSSEAGGQKI